jgi:hypothetical protein
MVVQQVRVYHKIFAPIEIVPIAIMTKFAESVLKNQHFSRFIKRQKPLRQEVLYDQDILPKSMMHISMRTR